MNAHLLTRWLRTALPIAVILALTGVWNISQPTDAQAQRPQRYYPPRAIGFSSPKNLQGIPKLNFPTSLEFGPDDRLYVSERFGAIYAFTVERNNATGTYTATDIEIIDLVANIPNHNDDGSPAPDAAGQRQVTGIYLDGTYEQPILYVTSSDPRTWNINGGSERDTGLDTNSGIVSRLTQQADGSWDMVHLVRGLPRSEELHSTNGLVIDHDTNTLYVMSGGHTNKGSPGAKFSYTPEYALSGALLSVDLDVINAMPVKIDAEGQKYLYDLPTLDDPTRGTPGQPDPGDPFGGNDGLNQAMIVQGGPVQIYSPGYRNAFDIVLTQDTKRLYTFDNGPNTNWGGMVANQGVNGVCTNEPTGDSFQSTGFGDHLHYITGKGFYGGHPNPTRGNPLGAGLYYHPNPTGNSGIQNYNFYPGWSPVPSEMANPIECSYRDNLSDGSLVTINHSTNGLVEYTASNFGGDMKGDLLTASYDHKIYHIALNEEGDQAPNGAYGLFSGFGITPLDVTAQSDYDVFPGSVWAVTYISGDVTAFEPTDFAACTGVYDDALDEDVDGYSNADEIDNGTNPCSGGSRPNDFDGDFISDLNDPDDDNDGILDLVDAFAIDAQNGMDVTIPFNYPFFNDDPAVGFFGLGFVGLMTNGTTDYLDMFDLENLTAGGAVGKFTVDAVTAGTAHWGNNTQDNAFQMGVNVDSNSAPFALYSQIDAPFFNNAAPLVGHSQGVYIGTGDQDNYLQVVYTTDGIHVMLEENGMITHDQPFTSTITGDLTNATKIEIRFVFNPQQSLVQPAIRVDDGAWVELGNYVTIPAAWLSPSDNKGLAFGLIATSGSSAVPFTATWSHLIGTLADAADVPATPTPEPTTVTPEPTTVTPEPTTETPTPEPTTVTPEPTETATVTPEPTTVTPEPTETATPTITPEPIGVELLINGGMEAHTDKVPDAWKLKNATNDKIKCDKPEKDKFFAANGACAFMFKGGTGENAKLNQSVELDTLTFNAGDTLTFSANVNAKKAETSGKIKVRVKYTDQAEKGKITLKLTQTDGYAALSDTLTLASANIEKLKVVVVHKSTSGKVFIDDLSLRLEATGSSDSELLPLPLPEEAQ